MEQREKTAMAFIPLDVMKAGAFELGIDLSDRQLDLLDRFALLLVDTNRQLNLTRITEPQDIVTKHYLDSLLYLWAFEFAEGVSVIDIGAGAGFPGIPIKIARPDLRVVLLDSTAKKVRFLEHAISELALEGVETIHGRAEDLAHQKNYREQFDVAVARALAELKILAELCLPLVRIGGGIVASKGDEIHDELTAARPVIGQLGGVVEKIVRTHIPCTDIGRQLIVIAKAKQTPVQFPRSYAQISRRKSGK